MTKILLVEDDNNLREIYGERLMAEGYDIVSASDGEEALQTAVTEKPDLIISDVMMPKISGFDMLDILRQTPETKDVKIIMMTALSQAEDKTRADKLGADKYLVKSQVTLEDVARVVHDLLGDDTSPEAEMTPDATTQTNDTVESSDQQVAPTPSVQEPTVVVAQPVVMAPEPMAEQPAPEPQVQDATVEPIVTPVQEPVAAAPVMTEPISTPSAPTNPISGSSSMPIDPAAAQAQTAQAEDSQIELQEVAQQIEQFVASSAPEVEHQEPVHEPTQQDIIHAHNAAEEPEIVSAQPAVAGVATNVPPVMPINTSSPEPASSRKKIISPINGDGLSTPDIHALYEQELAKEAADSPITNPASGQVVTAPMDAPAQNNDEMQNPISTAPEIATEVAPPPLETVDATQIAGVYASEEEAELAAASEGLPTNTPAQATATPPVALPTTQQPATNPSDPNNIAL